MSDFKVADTADLQPNWINRSVGTLDVMVDVGDEPTNVDEPVNVDSDESDIVDGPMMCDECGVDGPMGEDSELPATDGPEVQEDQHFMENSLSIAGFQHMLNILAEDVHKALPDWEDV